jgi:chromosome segregation ATPase
MLGQTGVVDGRPDMLEAENKNLAAKVAQLEAALATCRDQQEADLEEAAARHQFELEAVEVRAGKYQQDLEAMEDKLRQTEQQLQEAVREQQHRAKVQNVLWKSCTGTDDRYLCWNPVGYGLILPY